MKILDSEQIRYLDCCTIKNEPIKSIDLMERASTRWTKKFESLFKEKKPCFIFCGTGNNGGDGLAIGRLLISKKWFVSIFIVGDIVNASSDFLINLEKIDQYQLLQTENEFPQITNDTYIIDALFGNGLNRKIEGTTSSLISYLNTMKGKKIAVDISSGLFANRSIEKDQQVFKADFTLSFQVPKLAFVQPSLYQYVGQWHIIDIGLDTQKLQKIKTLHQLITTNFIKKYLPPPSPLSHKGARGKLTLITGSKGKMGAGVLCAKAAFRTGIGLLKVYTPKIGEHILLNHLPEAMTNTTDDEADFITKFPDTQDSIGMGCGIGTHNKTLRAFREFLQHYKKPMVIDADGINLVAMDKHILKNIPPQSILTPHIMEFKRLVGDFEDDYEKLSLLRNFCTKNKLNVLVKGPHSVVCTSDGNYYYNTTGNPGMATAGSGDVLTGIVSTLLAQNISPDKALITGTYLHGLAGNIASKKLGLNSLIASDIVQYIPKAIKMIQKF